MTGTRGIGRRRKGPSFDSALAGMEKPPAGSESHTQVMDLSPLAGEPDITALLDLPAGMRVPSASEPPAGPCCGPGLLSETAQARQEWFAAHPGDERTFEATLRDLGLTYLADPSLPVPVRAGATPETGEPDAGPAVPDQAAGAPAPGVPGPDLAAGPVADEGTEDENAAKECAG